VVVNDTEYATWLATKKPFYTEEMAKQIQEAAASVAKAKEEKLALNTHE
jgi:hypothetical protein